MSDPLTHDQENTKPPKTWDDVRRLQPLKPGETFVCWKCRKTCIQPEAYEHTYVEERDAQGNITRQIKGWEFRSACCKDGFSIFDTINDCEVAWEW